LKLAGQFINNPTNQSINKMQNMPSFVFAASLLSVWNNEYKTYHRFNLQINEINQINQILNQINQNQINVNQFKSWKNIIVLALVIMGWLSNATMHKQLNLKQKKPGDISLPSSKGDLEN
jgi:division protein CdvB (Snf7/Vps24/ESCRT-III family)